MTPKPAYVAASGSPLVADPESYGPIARELHSRTLLRSEVIPVRTGRAWVASAGSVVRFTIIEGPQVLDLNIWNSTNPRERFWAARTRQFYGSHVTVGDRLWSNLPFLRPLATVVADSIGYGLDADGAGCHDLLGTRCDPYVNQLLQGTVYDFHCHSNLVRAVLPHGLNEFDVHDVINVFQVTGLTPDERYFMKTCPAQIGDHFELFCETDLLMAASTCPGGDLAIPLWGAEAGGEPNCNPVLVEIYGVAPELLEGWRPSSCVPYVGMQGSRHGLVATEDVPPPLTEAISIAELDPPVG